MKGPNKLQTWQNWEGNQRCVADVYHAETVDDLKLIFRKAAEEHKTIRVSGGGRGTSYSNSFSGSPVVTNESGIILYVSKLNKAFAHEDGSGRITAEAGMTIEELEAFAVSQGLSFETSPVPPFIEVGGAVALGCHGSGRRYGTISDQVVSIDIVTPDGNLRTISERDGSSLLRAARVSLGALGLIYRVTFQCEKQFKLKVVNEKLPLDDTIRNIQSLVEAHDYVEVFWFPFCDVVSVRRYDRVPWETPNLNVPGPFSRPYEQLQTALGAFLLREVVKHPRFTPPLTRFFMSQQPSGTMVVPTQVAFHYQHYFPRQLWDLSYAIDVGPNYERFQSAWRFVCQKVCEYAQPKHGCTSGLPWAYDDAAIFPQNFIMHARFIKSSDAYLAPSVGNSQTCMLQIVTNYGTDCMQYLNQLEEYFLSLGSRPHWGKTFNVDLDFAKLYGDNLTHFAAIRDEMDPEGLLLNDFMRKVFRH